MKTYLLVALGIGVLAAAPLTYPGPLQTHAGLTPLYALMGDADATARVGPLVVNIARTLNGAAHWLPATTVDALKKAGYGQIDAFKLISAFALVGGALGMFMLARPSFGDMGALAASAAYALLPYRLMTAYIRGADGETLFLGLLPWIAAGSWVAAVRISQRMPLTRWVRIGVYAAGGFFALLLWSVCVPHAPDSTQAQAFLFQVFSARWDYGGQGNWLGAVPLQVGIVPVALGAIAILTRPDRISIILLAPAAILVALSVNPISGSWPWPWLLSEPWQVLGVAGFCLALLTGALVARSPELQSLPALAGIVLLIVLGSYPNLQAQGTDYAPSHLALAQYDSLAYLVDVNIPPLQPGATVTATIVWQDIAPFDDDYKVFVHIIDAQSKIWAQRDSQPLNGSRPTMSWQRGELLCDPYPLAIPADAPGGLRVEAGLYRSSNGQRLQTARGDDHVVVTP